MTPPLNATSTFFIKEDKRNGYVNLYAHYDKYDVDDRLALIPEKNIPELYLCLEKYMQTQKVQKISIVHEFFIPGLKLWFSRFLGKR